MLLGGPAEGLRSAAFLAEEAERVGHDSLEEWSVSWLSWK